MRFAGGVLAQSAFKSVKRRTSAEEYGGQPLLGVNGICIKAHGNSSAKAIRNAIRAAREAVTQKVNPSIVCAIAKYNDSKPVHESGGKLAA
jgi:glycerol-3-phosphate acyltransferase PlsX